MGLIDENILVMGSANWTKAAFSKNHDFLLLPRIPSINNKTNF